MKKPTIIIFLALAMLKAQAQDYLISFAGSGGTTVVDTVKVDNLTSGATATLNGGDILHLIAPVGINALDIDNGTLQIYPNPMAGQSLLTFVAPESDNAILRIFDLSEKTVYQISTFLSAGVQSFRISGISRGMYFVRITANKYNYSAKMISQSDQQDDARIEFVSSFKNATSNPLKSITTVIDMPYTDGDQLLYKGISGIYSAIVTDVPTSSETITFNFVLCTDNNGNNYTTVTIGTQIWMAENLNVGTRINGTVEQTDNGIIEKYCFNDNEVNCDTYGGLYQWNEMMQYITTPGVQGICPSGWHIPADAELTTLTSQLGGTSVAGGKMKETGTTHWTPPNTGATNTSGFTALPGGGRYDGGDFYGLSNFTYFWSSTGATSTNAWERYLNNNEAVVYRGNYVKTNGFSVRCLRMGLVK